MYCPKCGNELKLNAKFCGKCGFNIEPKDIDETISYKETSQKKKKGRIFVFIIGIIIVLVVIFALFLYFQGEKGGLFGSVIDTDGDGHSDNNDEFINDPNEWKDTDKDGIGDNADIYDNGNGGIYLSILSYDGDGGVDTGEYNDLDPYFIIWMDINGNNIIDDGEESTSSIYTDTDKITNPFSMIVDVPDNINELKMVVSVYDSDFWDSDDVIDISSSKNTTVATLRFHPHKDGNSVEITSNGSDDNIGNEDDAYIRIEYGIQKI